MNTPSHPGLTLRVALDANHQARVVPEVRSRKPEVRRQTADGSPPTADLRPPISDFRPLASDLRRRPLTVKHGNVTLTCYPTKRGGLIIPWYDKFGVRKLTMRATRASAEKFAREKASELAQADTLGAMLTSEESARYRLGLERLNKMNLSFGEALDIAERIVAAGIKSGASRHELLVELETNAAKRTTNGNKLCPDILDELIAAQTTAKAGDRWLDDLESRGRRIVKDFPGPLATVRGPDLLTWFNQLNLSDRSWNNYRTVLVALVKFAKKVKYLAPDWDELSAVEPIKIEKEEAEELYTPEEIQALLFTAEKHYPQHLPALAIMGLDGCRHCELAVNPKLDWQDVHLPRRLNEAEEAAGKNWPQDVPLGKIRIRLTVAKSKTGQRYVDMPPHLAAWLEPYAKPRGPVCVVENLTNAFARIAKKAGVKWKANALRNTYISVWCAITENTAKVAKQAGNSVREIEDSYFQEMTREEAQRYLEIYPTRPDILPLFAHAKLLANC